jgi:hypothetical protein
LHSDLEKFSWTGKALEIILSAYNMHMMIWLTKSTLQEAIVEIFAIFRSFPREIPLISSFT